MRRPTVSPRKRKRSFRDTDADRDHAEFQTDARNTESPSGRPFLNDEMGEASSPRTFIAESIQSLGIQEDDNMPRLKTGTVARNDAGSSLSQSSFNFPALHSDSQHLSKLTPTPSPPLSSPPNTPATLVKSTIPTSIINSIPNMPETPSLRPIRESTSLPSDFRGELKSSAAPSLALWWSDAEITGHELDSRDPSDDGEGINGVGFLPTPAIAYARAERRRRQVSEWKERECKEARVKRAQKRRRHDLKDEMTTRNRVESQCKERRVRFVEV